MFEKSDLKKLAKKELISEIKKLRNILKIAIWLPIGISLIVPIILIIVYATPLSCGLEVIAGGENIELDLLNEKEGEWWIQFRTTGFIPTKNIILHVEFLDEYAVIDYNDTYFSKYAVIRYAQNNNGFECEWDSYLGDIIVGIRDISVNSTMHDLDNSTRVTITTDGHLVYNYFGYN